jgi:hypothetical protein
MQAPVRVFRRAGHNITALLEGKRRAMSRSFSFGCAGVTGQTLHSGSKLGCQGLKIDPKLGRKGIIQDTSSMDRRNGILNGPNPNPLNDPNPPP